MSDSPLFKHSCGQMVRWHDGKLVDAEPHGHWPTHWKHVNRPASNAAVVKAITDTFSDLPAADARAALAKHGSLEKAVEALLKERGA